MIESFFSKKLKSSNAEAKTNFPNFGKFVQGFSALIDSFSLDQAFFNSISGISSDRKSFIGGSTNLMNTGKLGNEIKLKLQEYLKSNTPKNSIKPDFKSFFSYSIRELLKDLSNVSKHYDQIMLKDFNIEHSVSFIKFFYDFEDQLFISVSDIQNLILNQKAGKSQFFHLINSMTIIRYCESIETVYDKDFDYSELLKRMMNLLEILKKISKMVNSLKTVENSESEESSLPLLKYNSKFVSFYNFSTIELLPAIQRCFTEILSDTDMKGVFALISIDSFVTTFSYISDLSLVRRFVFDCIIKINMVCKDSGKQKSFKKYITENKFVISVFRVIKQVYAENQVPFQTMFTEILKLILITNCFSDNMAELKAELFIFLKSTFEQEILEEKKQIMNVTTYSLLFADFEIDKSTITKTEDFFFSINYFIKELLFMSYTEKNDIKALFNEKSLSTFSTMMHFTSSISIYKDYDFLEFIVDLFLSVCQIQTSDSENREHYLKTETVKRIILKFLLDTDPSLPKYTFLVNKSTFCDRVLGNVACNSSEVISYIFSCLMILFSENLSQDSTYLPDKEFVSIFKNLKQKPQPTALDEYLAKLDLVVKNFISLIEISNEILDKLVANSKLFEIIKEQMMLCISKLSTLPTRDFPSQISQTDIIFYSALLKHLIEILFNIFSINFSNDPVNDDAMSESKSMKKLNKKPQILFLNNKFFAHKEFINEALEILISYPIDMNHAMIIKKIGYRFLYVCLVFDEKPLRYVEFISNSLINLEYLANLNSSKSGVQSFGMVDSHKDVAEGLNSFSLILQESLMIIETILGLNCRSSILNKLNTSKLQKLFNSFISIIQQVLKHLLENTGIIDYACLEVFKYSEAEQAEKLLAHIAELFTEINLKIFEYRKNRIKNLMHKQSRILASFNSFSSTAKISSGKIDSDFSEHNLVSESAFYEFVCFSIKTFRFHHNLLQKLIIRNLHFALFSPSEIIQEQTSLYEFRIMLTRVAIDSIITIKSTTMLQACMKALICLIKECASEQREGFEKLISELLECLIIVFENNEYNHKIFLETHFYDDLLDFFQFYLSLFNSLGEALIEKSNGLVINTHEYDELAVFNKSFSKLILKIFSLSFPSYSKSKLGSFFDFYISLIVKTQKWVSGIAERVEQAILRPESESNSLEMKVMDQVNKFLDPVFKSCSGLLSCFVESIQKSASNPCGVLITSQQQINQENIFNQIYSHGVKLNNQPQIQNFFKSTPIKYNQAIPLLDDKYLSIICSITLVKTELNRPFKILRIEPEHQFVNQNTGQSFIEFELSHSESTCDSSLPIPTVFKVVESGSMKHSVDLNDIRLKKNLRWLFLFNKEKQSLEIFLNELSIFNRHINFKTLELVQNAPPKTSGSSSIQCPKYSFTSGFDFKDLGSTKSQATSEVVLSYILVYLDKLSIDHMLTLKFAGILVGKNGSAKSQVTTFKSLNNTRYKMFTPSFNYSNSREKLFSIQLNLNPSLIAYEVFLNSNDSLELISNKELNRLSRTEAEINLIVAKIYKKNNLDLLKEDFVCTIKNTSPIYNDSINSNSTTQTSYNIPSFNLSSYSTEDSSQNQNNINNYINTIYSNTYNTVSTSQILHSTFLLSKTTNNSMLGSRSILINETSSNLNNIKSSYYVKDLFESKITMLSQNVCENIIQSSTSITHTLNLMNECQETKPYEHIFTMCLKVIVSALLSDISKLALFAEGPSFRSLKVVLINKSKLISLEAVDLIFCLSLATNCISEFNFFNPLLPGFITEIFLDKDFFGNLQMEVKHYIIDSLINYIEQKKFTLIINEGTYDFLISVCSKLFNLLMNVDYNCSRSIILENGQIQQEVAFQTERKESEEKTKQIMSTASSLGMELDDLISNLVILILDMILKFKSGDVEPRRDQLMALISSTQSFILIAGYFDAYVSMHMQQRKNKVIDSYPALIILKSQMAKLYSGKVEVTRDKILKNFKRIYQEINSQKSYMKASNKLQAILSPSFFLNLFTKELGKVDQPIKMEPFVDTSLTGDFDLGEDTTKPKDDNNDDWTLVRVKSNINNAEPNDKNNFNVEYLSVVNSEFECCGYNCIFCYLLFNSVKESMLLSIDFDNFKNTIKESYLTFYNKGRFKSIREKSISISMYCSDSEGHARTRNKLEPRIDLIYNEELNKKFYEDFPKIVKDKLYLRDSLFDKTCFTSKFDIKNRLIQSFVTDRLFHLNSCSKIFSSSFLVSGGGVSNNKTFNTFSNPLASSTSCSNPLQELVHIKYLNNLNIKPASPFKNFAESYFDIGGVVSAWNCCVIDHIHLNDCVLVIGTKSICLLYNCHLTKNGSLSYVVGSKNKFSLGFWSTNNYSEEWQKTDAFYDLNFTNNNIFAYDDSEEYLNLIESNSKTNNRVIVEQARMAKFRRNESFRIVTIRNCDIIEIHKRKYLLQNNSIEIFTRKGLNILFATNLDNRDNIFVSLTKNCSGYEDYTQELLLKYNTIFNTFFTELIHTVLVNDLNYNSKASKTLFKPCNTTITTSKVFTCLILVYLNLINEATIKGRINSEMFNNSGLFSIAASRATLNLNYGEYKHNHTSSNNIGNNSAFLSFSSKIVLKRDKTYQISDSEPGIADYKAILEEAVSAWTKGTILNFDYLMLLNTLSGRTYVDLTSYMIMPWILSDYSSEGINLHNKDVYRNLAKPIHALSDSNNLEDKFTEADDEDKFHSGSHYSTSGFVCYFMIRSKSYSFDSAEIQGGYFDIADRLFSNIESIWSVAEKFQELIPQLFFMPELFMNFHDFDFGKGQSFIKVDDVVLPQWSRQDARLFTKMNKKALESYCISLNLCDWIDLIFGCKQQGKEAIKSFNIFRKICYEGKVDVDKLDNKEREDKLVEIRDFGQIPTQLFNRSHNKKDANGKVTEFFARPVYLIKFTVFEKPCLLLSMFTSSFKPSSNLQQLSGLLNFTNNFIQFELDLVPKQARFFCEKGILQGLGVGGISSFHVLVENDEIFQSHSKSFNSPYNSTILCNSSKELLGGRYTEFIEIGLSKCSFFLVLPFHQMCFEFFFNKEISAIKAVNDGKFTNLVLICFKDASIELYRLHRDKSKIFTEDQEKEKSLLSKIFGKTKESDSASELKSSPTDANLTKKRTLSNTNSGGLSLDLFSDLTDFLVYTNNNNIFDYFNSIKFPRISIYNNNWKDFMIHYSNPNLEIGKVNLAKVGGPYYFLQKVEELNCFDYPIVQIEIKKVWSIIVLADTKNKIFVLNLNSLKIMNIIDLREILFTFSKSSLSENSISMGSVPKSNPSKLKELTKNEFNLESIFLFDQPIVNVLQILIDDFTGEFIILTALQAFHFNINGVLISFLNLANDHASISNISCGLIKSVYHTQSEMHLFTGHNDGAIYMWRILPCQIFNTSKKSMVYGFSLNKMRGESDYNIELPYAYDTPFEFRSNNSFRVELLKISCDGRYLISVHENKMMQFWSYNSIFVKSKDKNESKLCPQCNSKINQNQCVICSNCKKKICLDCKLEDIIPEISLKSKKPVCTDCISMISSTNKLLYDF